MQQKKKKIKTSILKIWQKKNYKNDAIILIYVFMCNYSLKKLTIYHLIKK